MPIRRRFVVSGTVQGVGFRWATRARAVELGLMGFVRNRADGSVEIEAEGAAVDELGGWLAVGPPGAVVTGVESSAIPAAGHPGAGFSIQR